MIIEDLPAPRYGLRVERLDNLLNKVPGQDLGQVGGDLTGRVYWFWTGRQRGDFNMTIHVIDQ